MEFYLVVMMFGEPSFKPWALSFVRNPYDGRAKEAFWDELNGIGQLFGGPWLILGDFNALS